MNKKVVIPIIAGLCVVGIGGYSINKFKNTKEQSREKVTVAQAKDISTAGVNTVKTDKKTVPTNVTDNNKNEVQKHNNNITTNVSDNKATTNEVNGKSLTKVDKNNVQNKEVNIKNNTNANKESIQKQPIKSTSVNENQKTIENKNSNKETDEHINITNEYLKHKFASVHPNSEYNDVRNSLYQNISGKLRLSSEKNNNDQIDLINEINNISDSEFNSISHGVDPYWATPLLDDSGSGYPSIPVSVNVNGRTKTVQVSLASMG